jgi:hypothetical protein
MPWTIILEFERPQRSLVRQKGGHTVIIFATVIGGWLYDSFFHGVKFKLVSRNKGASKPPKKG